MHSINWQAYNLCDPFLSQRPGRYDELLDIFISFSKQFVLIMTLSEGRNKASLPPTVHWTLLPQDPSIEE